MAQPISREAHRPYLIVADFPGELPRAIGRSYNKSDADEHIRFLKRKMAAGAFYIVFDPEPQQRSNE